jgi:hypothetical protein
MTEPAESTAAADDPLDAPPGAGPAVRAATVVAVVAVAGIAAAVSYRHMRAVALGHGEDPANAAVIPLSVDGLIVAASMSLLHASRAGRKPPALAYALLVAGSAASLAANVIHAEPGMVARVIAAWPPFALIGAYELLMRMIRAGGPAPTRPRPDRDAARPARIGNRPPAAAPAACDPAPGRRAADPDAGPAPAAVTPIGQARHRPGTKRARLCDLLSAVPPGDPRSAYALAKAFAPLVGLHEGTARRYIAEQRQAS